MRKILFIGRKLFGEAVWNKLREAEGNTYEIVAACSNMSADNVWWRSNKIYETRGNVPFIDNSERNEAALLDAIDRYGADTILCAQHPWILSGEVLAAVKYNALNFHNAKLPTYRGCNAINHAILNGDKHFVCTVHWIIDKVDLGDIAFEAQFDIAPGETALSLYAKCHHAGLRLIDKVIPLLGGMDEIPRRAMASGGRFYSRKSIEPLREIKDLSPAEVDNRARAFYFPPFEPAYALIEGQKFYLLPKDFVESGFDANLKTLHDAIELAAKQVECDVL